jgi:ribonuclease HIII
MLIELYESIKPIMQSEKFHVSNYKLIDYGLQFDVSSLDWSGKIRIYQNKKNEMKIDYSQLKGLNAKIVQNLIESKNFNSIYKKDRELGFPIIGTDESGKGDYFGPLVSAAVYVDEMSAKDLFACGVKDSKMLSDLQNLELSKTIAEICKGQFVIIEIKPERYNILYNQFRKEEKNLNILLAWEHAKAIEELLLKVNCKTAIIDQFADEKVILGKLQERGKELRLVQRHKAEDNIAVAAASIIARARFLDSLHKLSNKYDINLPKGASENTIKVAKIFINKYGIDSLGKIAKIHFKITKSVLVSMAV